MEYPTTFLGWLSFTSIGALAFVSVITTVVFVHELGHFLAARYFGVRVESFSIGFGRAIIGFKDRLGTHWKIGWLPLGGYVKFWGDESVSSTPDHQKLDHASAAERAGSFHHKPLWQKAIIAVGGPVANFILAFFVFAALAWTYGDVPPRVGEVMKGMPGDTAGIKTGDIVEEIQGQKILGFRDLTQIVTLSEGVPLQFVILRGTERLSFPVTPVTFERENGLGGKLQLPAIGIRNSPVESLDSLVKYSILESVYRGYRNVRWYILITSQFIGKLLTGTGDYKQVSGVIGIATVSSQVAVFFGVVDLINLAAVLSVSIGLLNLFPIPMLDGGHLLYYGIEAVRGRPLGERAQEFGFRIGLVLVVCLMLFATWNDITKFNLF
ncbi:MAG: RIP metalloprotease RseP [Micropepsaceae bacterium]